MSNSSLQTIGTGRYRLEAQDGWSSTGINISTGDIIRIQYIDGYWSPWLGNYTNAEGATTLTFDDIIAGCKHGALIGRIGQNDPFCIGKNDFSKKGQEGGILYLMINDTDLNDNSGSIDLSITINGNPAQ